MPGKEILPSGKASEGKFLPGSTKTSHLTCNRENSVGTIQQTKTLSKILSFDSGNRGLDLTVFFPTLYSFYYNMQISIKRINLHIYVTT